MSITGQDFMALDVHDPTVDDPCCCKLDVSPKKLNHNLRLNLNTGSGKNGSAIKSTFCSYRGLSFIDSLLTRYLTEACNSGSMVSSVLRGHLYMQVHINSCKHTSIHIEIRKALIKI